LKDVEKNSSERCLVTGPGIAEHSRTLLREGAAV